MLLLTLPFSPHRLFDWIGKRLRGGKGPKDVVSSLLFSRDSCVVAEGFEDHSHILREKVGSVVSAHARGGWSGWHHLQETRSADIN